jgi:hypothetical protein
MYRNIQDVALVGYQPSAQKARQLAARISPDRLHLGRHHDPGEWQHEFAFERIEAPRLRKSQTFDLQDTWQIAD